MNYNGNTLLVQICCIFVFTAPKVPTGGVAVLPSMPPGPTPLISTSPIPVVSQQQGKVHSL